MGPEDGRPLQGTGSNEDSMRITRQWDQDRPMRLQPSPFPGSHGGLQTYKISLSDQRCLDCFVQLKIHKESSQRIVGFYITACKT